MKGIPYIIGVVDSSHVPIIAPKIDPASYYSQNDSTRLCYKVSWIQNACFGTLTLVGHEVITIGQCCKTLK